MEARESGTYRVRMPSSWRASQAGKRPNNVGADTLGAVAPMRAAMAAAGVTVFFYPPPSKEESAAAQTHRF